MYVTMVNIIQNLQNPFAKMNIKDDGSFGKYSRLFY